MTGIRRAALAAIMGLALLPAGAWANAEVEWGGTDPVVVTADDEGDTISVSMQGNVMVITGGEGTFLDVANGETDCQKPDANVNVVHCDGADIVDIFGNGGNDTLTLAENVGSDEDHNVLDGAAGTDTLTGGGFDDYITPGTGTDITDGGDGGFDTVSYEALPGPVNITVNGVADDGPAGENDTLNGFERYVGSQGNDVFVGSAGSESFDGVAGNDTMDGLGNHDELIGDEGDDTLRGGEGSDEAFGGNGNDVIDGDAGADFGLFGNGGNDTIRGGADGDDSLNGGDGDDNVDGGAGGDSSIDGGDGNDTVSGGEGSDFDLNGGDGNDTVTGGDGDDSTVAGNAGNDLVDGGPGDDRVSGGTGSDDVRGGDGVDLGTWFPFDLNTGNDLPVNVSLDGVANDGITGESDNARPDIEDVATGDANDTITGSDGSNQIDSNGGNDTIDGRGGADRIFSGAGDDNVTIRDQTPDTLSCGAGTDTTTADTIDTVFLCEVVNAAPLPPGPDVTPPNPKLTVKSAIRVRDLRKPIVITVDSGTETVAFAFELLGRAKTYPRVSRTGDIVLGTKSLKAGTGKRKTSIKLGSKQRRAIRRGARLTLRTVATDAAGNKKTITKTIRIR